MEEKHRNARGYVKNILLTFGNFLENDLSLGVIDFQLVYAGNHLSDFYFLVLVIIPCTCGT